MPDPTPEPGIAPVDLVDPEGPEEAAIPDSGGDEPPEVEVDLDEQVRRDAERDRELREKYGDREY